eukprot:evm.model.scf_1234.1 EVM.evm.TU.scf_1234.1   scf_1234:13481-14988(-)
MESPSEQRPSAAPPEPAEQTESASMTGKPATTKEAAPQPWDWTLRFRDADLEAEYRASESTGARNSADFALMFAGIAVMSGVWIWLVPAGEGATGKLELFLLVGLRIAAVVMIWKWRELYESNRLVIVAFLRLQTVMYLCRVLPAPTEVIWTAGALSRHLVLRSIVFPMVSFIARLKLPFPQHLCVQGACCMVSILWMTDSYCRSWLEPSRDLGQYLLAYNTIGETIDTTIVRATHCGFLSPPAACLDSRTGETTCSNTHSCWLVVAFFQVLGGFVIPSVYHYFVESSCRTRFLVDRAADVEERGKLARMRNESMFVMVWLGVVALMAAWFGLKYAEEIAHEAGTIWTLLNEGHNVCKANDLGLN